MQLQLLQKRNRQCAWIHYYWIQSTNYTYTNKNIKIKFANVNSKRQLNSQFYLQRKENKHCLYTYSQVRPDHQLVPIFLHLMPYSVHLTNRMYLYQKRIKQSNVQGFTMPIIIIIAIIICYYSHAWYQIHIICRNTEVWQFF